MNVPPLIGYIFLFSAGPSLLLGIASLFSKRSADHLLGLILTLLGYVLLIRALGILGLWEYIPRYFAIPLPAGFVLGPAFYLYVRSTLGTKKQANSWVHFLPAVAAWGIVIRVELRGLETIQNFFTVGPSTLRFNLNLLVVLHFAIYVWQSLRSLSRKENEIKLNTSDLEDFKLGWLRYLITVFTILCLGYGIALIGLIAQVRLDISLGILICGVVYAVAVYVLKSSAVFWHRLEEFAAEPHVELESPKYATSGLQPETAKERASEVYTVLKSSGVYLNPNFKLSDLAREMKTNPYQMSQILNIGLEQNFYSLVNRLRIEEVQRRLDDPNCKSTIIEIAYAVGFNSKSAFNRSFRQVMGMTPSKYRESKTSKDLAG